MSIRLKIGLILTAVILSLAGVLYAASNLFIMKGFLQVEERQTQKSVAQATDGLKSVIDQLTVKLADWAAWDDTHNFAKGVDPDDFVGNNFTSTGLEGINVNMMIIVNNAGRTVGGIVGDLESGEELTIPEDLKPYVAKGSKLLVHETTDSFHEGVIMLDSGPLAFSARPIVDSNGEGPSTGTIFFGRYINAAAVKEISDVTHLPVELYRYDKKEGPADVQSVHGALSAAPVQLQKLSEDTIAGYALLTDANDKPALILKITEPRDVYNQGKASLNSLVLSILLGGVASTLLSMLLIDRFLARRVAMMAGQVASLKPEQLNTTRLKLPANGRDEVSQLGAAINGMLERIQASSQRVTELLEELRREKAGVERLVEKRTEQLAEERTRFLASITSLPLGFILIDSTQRILMMNPAMAAMLGFGKATLAEKAEEMASDESFIKMLINPARDTMAKNKPATHELSLKDGRVLHTMTAPVIPPGGKKAEAAVILVEDVTEARVLARSKEEFFSIASHELRTPLTAIRGNTSMIKDYYQEALKDPSLSSMIEDIHGSSVRLITMVNDFLDAGRLEQDRMVFRPAALDPNELVEGITHELEPLAKVKGLKIQVDPSLAKLPMVLADPDRVRQVVFNLTANAINYTDKGKLTLSGEHAGDKVIVRVTDTGRGISPEGQKLLFHKFQQAGDSLYTRDTVKGTGLGLYLSKMLIERMGGTIQLEKSVLGKGSTFSVTIPVAKGGKAAKTTKA